MEVMGERRCFSTRRITPYNGRKQRRLYILATESGGVCVCICLAVFGSCTCVSALRALGWLGHYFRDDTYLLTRCYTHFSLLSDVVLIELPELGGLYINKILFSSITLSPGGLPRLSENCCEATYIIR